jgi:hypothetical protein
MSDFGDSQVQEDGHFVVWACICDAAEASWLALGSRADLAAALDVAMALYELGRASPHYLGVRVTYRHTLDSQRPLYERLVPDMATRIAKVQPIKLAASRRKPSEN